MIIEDIEQLRHEMEHMVLNDSIALEQFRFTFISKKGKVAHLFEQFKALPPVEKKQVGAALNDLKREAEVIFKHAVQQLEHIQSHTATSFVDVTLPAFEPVIGGLHPLHIIQHKAISIFERMGFNLVKGAEIVDDWHNFGALNFPENHPAREMQDTFFLARNPDQLLRTHTTSVQIETCTKQEPPIRSITVGRVFRNEAVSARSHCFFHQLDGMYINTNVGFNDLKETIYHFVYAFFGVETKLRFRASYFPFTEPSAEVDIHCRLCNGGGCTLCKQTGWVEILGAGMIDPNVLTNCHIHPHAYSGFAFGMGIERIAMLYYQIEDLRLFSENHIDFLSQFRSCLK